MPAFQIRDLPECLYDELRLRAQMEHRSMAQQATVAIEQHLRLVPAEDHRPCPRGEAETRATRAARCRAIFDEVDRMRGSAALNDAPSVVDLIAEGRRERDGRFGC